MSSYDKNNTWTVILILKRIKDHRHHDDCSSVMKESKWRVCHDNLPLIAGINHNKVVSRASWSRNELHSALQTTHVYGMYVVYYLLHLTQDTVHDSVKESGELCLKVLQ